MVICAMYMGALKQYCLSAYLLPVCSCQFPPIRIYGTFGSDALPHPVNWFVLRIWMLFLLHLSPIIALPCHWVTGLVEFSSNCWMCKSCNKQRFIEVVTWYCQNWYMVLSKLLYGFAKIDTWISQSYYTDLPNLIHGFLKTRPKPT